MKIAIISDEVSQDIGEVIATVGATAISGIEIRSVADIPPHLLDDGTLRSLYARLSGAGLTICGFCPPLCKTPIPVGDAAIREQRDMLQKAVHQASLLGAPFVRSFTFYRDGAPDPEQAADRAREIFADMPKSGVKILFENGMRTNTPTLHFLDRFLDRLQIDSFGILWDPGNTVFAGADANPFPYDYEYGRFRIEHVHVKDPNDKGAYVRVGDGRVPWGPIAEQLTADGFEGFMSLETHWRAHRALTQPERDDPWGTAFSDGGLEASFQCIHRLAEIVGVHSSALVTTAPAP